MNLKTVTIADLEPHPDNPNTHPTEQIDALADSLTKFTQVKNVVIWNNRIIAGHGVIEAAKKSGILTLEAQDVSHWPEDKATQFMLADIRLPDMGFFDEAAMAEALRHIDEPTNIPGIDEEFLEGLIGWETEPPKAPPEPQVDKAEELREVWRTEVGQMWQLGEHRVICGDCTDKAVVERVMGGERVDCLIADPPYGMNLETVRRHGDSPPDFIRTKRNYSIIQGDEKDFDRQDVLIEAKEEFWFGGDYYVDTLPDYGKDGSWLVWNKRAEGGNERMQGSMFELIWSKKKHRREILHYVWNGVLGHIKKIDGDQKYHPAMKSTKMIMYIIDKWCDGLILDPFLGSGTTLIAAYQLNRCCIGIELDPGYIAVTLQRFLDHTSTQPELIK